jgi:hypothetical protein
MWADSTTSSYSVALAATSSGQKFFYPIEYHYSWYAFALDNQDLALILFFVLTINQLHRPLANWITLILGLFIGIEYPVLLINCGAWLNLWEN